MLFGELLSRYYTLVFIMVILLYTIFFNKMTRLIGASELAKLAQELETAGREGDVQRIQQDTDGILKKYVWFYDRLDEIFRERN